MLEVCAATASSARSAVRKIAIGSLEPDSISSVALTRSRRWMPPARSRKNTAAASVEAMMAASRKPSIQPMSNSRWAAAPRISVVSSTPSVASTTAGAPAVRKFLMLVSKPLSNRMIARASVPMK